MQRPQIKRDDICIVKIDDATIHLVVVGDVEERGIWLYYHGFLYPFEQIVAIYRFNGMGFSLIWKQEDFCTDNFNQMVEELGGMYDIEEEN